MKIKGTITGLLLTAICFAQPKVDQFAGGLPVFRQVSYPFLPVLTSHFFFSDDGLMWFSTAKGLSSFDGTEVVYHCSIQQSAELGLNKISCFTEDSVHDFYLAAAGNLILFKRKERRFEKILSGLGVDLSFISLQKNGSIYIGTASRGMIIYHPLSKQMERFNLVDGKPEAWDDRYGNTLKCFAEHATDSTKCWIGSYNGIYLFDKITRKLSKNFIVSDSIYDVNGKVIHVPFDVHQMDVANDSTIWFNTWNAGFCSYNTRTGRVELSASFYYKTGNKMIPASVIPSFAKLEAGKYFIGFSNKHPCIFDIRTKTIQPLKVNVAGDTTDKISFCSTDKKGNLWLLRNGLLYVSVPGYSRLHSLYIGSEQKSGRRAFTPDNILTGIYFDRSTHLYYCAVHNAANIYVLDSSFNIVEQLPSPLFNSYFAYKGATTDKITKDGSGRYWVTGAETYILLPGKKKFEYAEKIFPQLAWLRSKGTFNCIATTGDGNILLQEYNSGNIYIIDHTDFFTDTIKAIHSIAGNKLRVYSGSFEYDPLHNYIYLSDDHDISQYRLAEKKMHKLSPEAIAGDPNTEAILNYALDAAGRIWSLKEQYGIRIIDPVTLKCIDSFRLGERGLYPGNYTNITGAAKGYMFLEGPHGIVVYNYTEQRSLLFDNTNGLSSPVPRSVLYSNGQLLLGQPNVIEHYDLADFSKNNFHLYPALTTIIADTTELFAASFADHVIQLPSYTTVVSLNFSAAEFIFPERIEYAYRLDDIDKEWKYTNYFNRRVNYGNLQPGKYIFKIKAQQVGGSWNVPVTTYTIIIAIPFWQTWWFRLLCFIAAGIVIFMMLRWRIKTIQDQERLKVTHEKELLNLEAKALRAQMNPHFIFNCLNSIKSLIQQHDEERSITYLTTFSKLIRTLFHNADKKEISLFDEIETCKLYLQLEAMRFDTKFSYTITIDEKLDLKSIEVPALVIQPFIENAIWHGIIPAGRGGHIEVSVQKKDADVLVLIDDNGIGRQASALNKPAGNMPHQSKGVKLTQSRIALDNLLKQRQAAIETIDKKKEDSSAAGTTVIIIFKDQLS